MDVLADKHDILISYHLHQRRLCASRNKVDKVGINRFVFFSLESGNLALGRPTFASSVRDGHSSSRAVDGEFDISNFAYETCFASEYEISPWFMLELDRLYTITRVTIYTCGKLKRILYQ